MMRATAAPVGVLSEKQLPVLSMYGGLQAHVSLMQSAHASKAEQSFPLLHSSPNDFGSKMHVLVFLEQNSTP